VLQGRARAPELVAYLREGVDRSGLTRTEYAQRIDVAWKTLSRYLNGRQVPQPDVCGRIALINGDDPEYVQMLAGHVPSPGVSPHAKLVHRRDLERLAAALEGMSEIDRAYIVSSTEALAAHLRRTRS